MTQQAATPVAPSVTIGNLRAGVTSFLGRDDELAELERLVESSRLVTLTGAPGIGKSRLALELARRVAGGFAEGTWIVELASVGERGLVAGAVAAALSVPEVAGESAAETLRVRLGARRMLLVMDNCEHLVEACARLVDDLLGACPGLKVLATSREPLAIAGERLWQVPPLRVPEPAEPTLPERLEGCEAVDLFVDRARAVQPSFELTLDAAADVGVICRRLDGMPLALELAAARVDVLAPTEIARRLDDRFSLLTKGSRSVLPRHQTLQAALDWSHDLLSPPERVLFRRLSVFVGGFCLDACEDVCSGGEIEASQILELLGGLVSRSLVGAQTGNGPRARFRLLETIRAYSSDRLEEAGEAAEVCEAHACFYLGLAERAEPELTGPWQEEWFERLEADRADLRAALEWSLGHGRSEWALRLAGALVVFWRVRCHFSEGRDLLDAALAANGDAAEEQKTKAIWGSGFMALMSGDVHGAVALLEESLSRFRALSDKQGCARALMLLANARQPLEDPGAMVVEDPRALALLEESVALAREAGDSWCLAHALGVAGYGHFIREDAPAARALFEESIRVAREARDMQGLRYGLLGLGELAGSRGDLHTAEPLLEEAVEVLDRLGEDYLKATALRELGQLAFARGEFTRARETLDEALTLTREVGSPGGLIVPLLVRARVALTERDAAGARRFCEEALAVARGGAGVRAHTQVAQVMGEVAAWKGDPTDARRLYEKALDLARSVSGTHDAAQALHALGELARGEGDAKRSAAHHDEALQLMLELGDTRGIAASLEAIGGLAAEAGRHEHGARLLAAADALCEENSYVRPPWASVRWEADLAVVRQSLPAGEFETAWTRGQRLSVEEAVAHASKGRGPRGGPASGWPSLTEAERRVAALVAEGLTNAEIAERLIVSPWTVKSHLSHVFQKLGIAGRRELGREFARGAGNGDRSSVRASAPADRRTEKSPNAGDV